MSTAVEGNGMLEVVGGSGGEGEGVFGVMVVLGGCRGTDGPNLSNRLFPGKAKIFGNLTVGSIGAGPTSLKYSCFNVGETAIRLDADS